MCVCVYLPREDGIRSRQKLHIPRVLKSTHVQQLCSHTSPPFQLLQLESCRVVFVFACHESRYTPCVNTCCTLTPIILLYGHIQYIYKLDPPQVHVKVVLLLQLILQQIGNRTEILSNMDFPNLHSI